MNQHSIEDINLSNNESSSNYEVFKPNNDFDHIFANPMINQIFSILFFLILLVL